jgi:hypothetical protein
MSNQSMVNVWAIARLTGISGLSTIITGGFHARRAAAGAVPPYVIITPMSDTNRIDVDGVPSKGNVLELVKIVTLGSSELGDMETAIDLIQAGLPMRNPQDMGSRGVVLGCTWKYTPPSYPENVDSKNYLHIPAGVFDVSIYTGAMAAINAAS